MGIGGVVMLDSYSNRMDITDKQQRAWDEIGSSLAATPQIRQLAINYYQQYRLAHSTTPDKLPLLMQVAFFLSQMSQVLHDKEGNPLKGIALSANAILRDHANHQEFLYHLKHMLRTVRIPQQASHLEKQATKFSKTLSFSLAFFHKMTTTFKKIHIGQRGTTSAEEKQQQQRLLWLLFISCRSQLQSRDLVEATCLMSYLFVFYLSAKYREEGVFSIYFGEETQGGTLDSEPKEITIYMQKYFHIQDTSISQRMQRAFKAYISSLDSLIGTTSLFSAKNCQRNNHILHKLYLKSLQNHDLDESALMKNQSQSLYGRRNTPFGRNRILAPRQKTHISHRILSYQWEGNVENQNQPINRSESKAGGFPLLKLMPTPKSALIRATPVSEAMQMYNWLLEISRRSVSVNPEKQAAQEIFEMMQKDGTSRQNQLPLDLLVGLWAQGLEHSGKNNHASLLLVSAHIVMHVLNIPSYEVEDVMRNLDLRGLQVWQALDFYLNHDKHMPMAIRLHLHSIESHFIKRVCWWDQEVTQLLINSLQSRQERLPKRVIHQCAVQIRFLCKKLQLTASFEDTTFALVESSLKSKQQLLWNRSLDQLIVCSLYGACKVKRNQLKLSQAMCAYREVFDLNARQFQELGQRTRVSQQEEGIIAFYNKVFMPTLKGRMYQLRQSFSDCEEKEGEVRELVAHGAFTLASPQMAMEFAYSQSPLLRPRLKDIGNSTTAPRDKQYTLRDIAAKFGKSGGGDTLRSTRKLKNSVIN